MNNQSISIAVAGSGGARAMTTGNALFDAAAKAGWYGILSRTQWALVNSRQRSRGHHCVWSAEPSSALMTFFDVLLAIDWKNIERFAPEIPLSADSLIICDVKAGTSRKK